MNPVHQSKPQATNRGGKQTRAAAPVTQLRQPQFGRDDARAKPVGQESWVDPEASASRIARLEALLMLEAEARGARTLRELIYCVANETQKCVPARQTYVLRSNGWPGSALKIDAVSNLVSVDRNAPAIRWLEEVFSGALQSALMRNVDSRFDPMRFEIPVPDASSAEVFPFRHGQLVPLADAKHSVFGVVVLLNETEFRDGSELVLRRLRDVYQHAWLALAPRPHNRLAWIFKKRVGLALAMLAGLVMFIPVRLTTLAPVEVVARQPYIVAAPIDGVVNQILVEPNMVVKRGQELFRYIDTDLSARHAIAEQTRNVARARLRTARQNAFGSATGRGDLAVAEAELNLAEAELVHAASQLAKTRVTAPRDGLVVFDRKSDWQGKPVTTGERVVEIANPALVEYRVDLAVSDAIVLDKGARTKVFLDANPLSPREAAVSSANYRASKSASDQLVYKVYASLDDDRKTLPRIGARGTAQIYGERVSLGFYLFRRPLSAIRQWAGL